ncbi:hypothetical protein [Kitasatospora sp. NPDC058218]|uniref:hypothetical protein n=1 Tax=Kitasatospora sp. NPDC058218 TaxID=3346385 RepID=UPI0036DDF588
MARRGGDLEAFSAFLGGLLAAGVTGLALVGAHELIEPGPWLRRAAPVAVGAVWLAVTVGLYRRLGAAARAGARTAPAGHRPGTPRPAGSDRPPARQPGQPSKSRAAESS